MTKLHLLLLAALCAGSVGCETSFRRPTSKQQHTKLSSIDHRGVIRNVKTTAYTHTEGDHIEFGAKSAVGSTLKFGNVRSAAADWSIYPVGTCFRIEGEPYVYEVDDYGSALVGTKTIDLYRPSKAAMDNWGARQVNIQVLKWGSFSNSLAIMKPREGKKPHIKEMIGEIEQKRLIPAG
jgi:3D (Asp-Asp-Asp) domain-containing protein